MPKNHFPDSAEKRELRRRDQRLIAKFAQEIRRGLDYCGMPSIEFLDVIRWQEDLRSVWAFENDTDIAGEMRIQRDKLGFPFDVSIHTEDILAFLQKQSDASFDLYNLDFYGGFLYPQKSGGAKSVSSIRSLFAKQANARRSFILICTFNVRECGAAEYIEFLDVIETELEACENCHANIEAHKASQADRLLVCFPAFCANQAQACGFTHLFNEAFLYRSSAQMIHFHQRFTLSPGVLPKTSYRNMLIDLSNRPLYELAGQVPKVRKRYPNINSQKTAVKLIDEA